MGTGGDKINMSETNTNEKNRMNKLSSIEEIKFYANDNMEIMGNELIEYLCKRYDMQTSQFPYYINDVGKYSYTEK